MPYEADVFTRQQIALEGVKNEVSYSFNDFATDVTETAIIMLLGMGRSTFEDMTRAEMRVFMMALNKKLSGKIKTFRSLTEKTLRAIMMADIFVSKKLAGHLAKINGIVPKRPFRPHSLWASLTNGIVPGSGITFKQVIKDYFGSIIEDTNKLLWIAYADKLTTTETIARVTGTKANGYKDGLARKMFNGFSSATDTLIQYVSVNVLAFIGSVYTEKYEWISVIDSGTTPTCRERDGKIYVFGKGPLPPAHYRCRSNVRPIFNENEETSPQTYYTWLRQQPPKVQNFVVGRAQAEQLRGKRAGADAFPKFASNKRLTPKEYKDSVNMMLTPSN